MFYPVSGCPDLGLTQIGSSNSTSPVEANDQYDQFVAFVLFDLSVDHPAGPKGVLYLKLEDCEVPTVAAPPPPADGRKAGGGRSRISTAVRTQQGYRHTVQGDGRREVA